MGQPTLSPYLIAALGIFLFILGLQAVRNRKIISSQGQEKGLRTPDYYAKLLLFFLASVAVFFWGGIEFHKIGSWLYSIPYVLLVSVLLWGMIKINSLRSSAKTGLKNALVPGKFSKAQANSPNMWSMSALALLSKVNHRNFRLLGGDKVSNSSRKYALKRLKKEWDILDAEDFEEIQDWLLTVGHRAEFHELVEKIMQSSEAEIRQYLGEVAQGEHGMSTKLEREEERARVQMIEEEGSILKNQGFMAWDQLRYMENCGLGFLAGYLDEETAWANLNSVAQVLQSRYDSWEDMANSYMRAREFWSAVDFRKRGKLYEKAFAKLLADRKSPWNQIAWDMPLHKPE